MGRHREGLGDQEIIGYARAVSFAKYLSILAALVAVGLATFKSTRAAAADPKPTYPPTLSGGAPCGSCIAPADLSWKTVVTSAKEPGEPLIISGTIYQPDGKPASGVVLFIYHTDATGYYNEKDDASHPRLKGWMKTGADGRYEFRTIKPAPYPHRTTPAHIHAHVYGPDYSERSIDDYWFEGDPFINAKELARIKEQGETPAIVSLKRDGAGVLRGGRDITLKRPQN
ncbi:MAG: protocatechuate 3,4-dioxygenase, beta subunit [Verrucomicrobiota bacterium]|jgi:protocatechuate 3,4-dioxygenase beta subunit